MTKFSELKQQDSSKQFGSRYSLDSKRPSIASSSSFKVSSTSESTDKNLVTKKMLEVFGGDLNS